MRSGSETWILRCAENDNPSFMKPVPSSLRLAMLVWPLVFPLFSQTATSAPATPPASVPKNLEAPYPDPPAVLPGKGLAQHDFLYTGEWDTRKDVATMFLVRSGKVVWSYQIPRKDESNG